MSELSIPLRPNPKQENNITECGHDMSFSMQIVLFEYLPQGVSCQQNILSFKTC